MKKKEYILDKLKRQKVSKQILKKLKSTNNEKDFIDVLIDEGFVEDFAQNYSKRDIKIYWGFKKLSELHLRKKRMQEESAKLDLESDISEDELNENIDKVADIVNQYFIDIQDIMKSHEEIDKRIEKVWAKKEKNKSKR